MRAVAVPRFRARAELMDLPAPTCGPGEVLVGLDFAGMNPIDWKIADGLLGGSRPHVFPLVLGVDGAGVVEAVGSSVTRFRRGDRVFGQFLHDPVGTGTYCELAPVPERIGIGPVPPGMRSDEAAALPTAGMTALASLDALGLSPGATLVVVGASGGVGSITTALATARGIRVVAVARASSSARLRSLGAEAVIDPSEAPSIPSLAKVDPAGIDGLLDLMSDAPGFARWASVVRRGGAAVTTTYSANLESLREAGVRGVNIDLQPNAPLLERLTHEVLESKLRAPVEHRVRLDAAPAALVDVKEGKASGKTVIDVRS